MIRGERLPLFGYLAIGIALVAVVLVGFVKEKGAVRPSVRALSDLSPARAAAEAALG